MRRWNGDTTHPPVLVGEDNPYGGRPANALYPAPAGCAGHRLCTKVFDMDPRQYLVAFLRYNLCTGKWRREEAERRAKGLILLYRENPKILLGAKVAAAFGYNYQPFEVQLKGNIGLGCTLILPHPSGRCRAWNDPKSYERARDALEEVLR